MTILRKMAEKFPNGVIDNIIKTMDDEFDKAIKIKIKEMNSKKPPAFITKF